MIRKYHELEAKLQQKQAELMKIKRQIQQAISKAQNPIQIICQLIFPFLKQFNQNIAYIKQIIIKMRSFPEDVKDIFQQVFLFYQQFQIRRMEQTQGNHRKTLQGLEKQNNILRNQINQLNQFIAEKSWLQRPILNQFQQQEFKEHSQISKRFYDTQSYREDARQQCEQLQSIQSLSFNQQILVLKQKLSHIFKADQSKTQYQYSMFNPYTTDHFTEQIAKKDVCKQKQNQIYQSGDTQKSQNEFFKDRGYEKNVLLLLNKRIEFQKKGDAEERVFRQLKYFTSASNTPRISFLNKNRYDTSQKKQFSTFNGKTSQKIAQLRKRLKLRKINSNLIQIT